jgi:hypothetical protein
VTRDGATTNPEKSMPITAQQLLQILPNAGKQAGVFMPGV